MKKRIILLILAIASPLILSAIFIAIGKTDSKGRITLTGAETTAPAKISKLVDEAQDKIAESAKSILKGLDVRQDDGNSETETPQLGASSYYKVDISTPAAFFNSVNGRGFNEGYGLQCVAGFKEFMYSLSGRIVATKTGGASGYANQQSQIEPLGFTWHQGAGGLQDGDWAIFRGGAYGHVAMRYQGKWFGQNQGAANANAGNAFNLLAFGTENVIGYYRPNIYAKKPAQQSNNNQKTYSDSGNKTNNEKSTTSGYVVESGDTIGDIIIKNGWRDYSVPLFGDNGQAQSIANKNGIKNRGLIYPNQVINK